MKRVFDVIVEKDEMGWYVGTVPALRGCATQGKTIKELERNIIEAIELCLEDEDRPSGESQFVGIRRVEVTA